MKANQSGRPAVELNAGVAFPRDESFQSMRCLTQSIGEQGNALTAFGADVLSAIRNLRRVPDGPKGVGRCS